MEFRSLLSFDLRSIYNVSLFAAGLATFHFLLCIDIKDSVYHKMRTIKTPTPKLAFYHFKLYLFLIYFNYQPDVNTKKVKPHITNFFHCAGALSITSNPQNRKSNINEANHRFFCQRKV